MREPWSWWRAAFRRAVMKAASSADSTGLGVRSSGTPAAAATGALAQPCGASGRSITDSVTGKAAPIASEAETESAPERRSVAPAGSAASGNPAGATTENGRPPRAATVSAGTEVGPAISTGTPRAAASADPASACAGEPSGETSTADAAAGMRPATAAAVAASVGPARRATGTPSAATAAAVASDTTPGPPTMSTSPPRAWMSAATSPASDPAGVISSGAPIERASGAAATPAAREAVPASAGPVRTTALLLGAEIRPQSTDVAAGVAPATRLALAHGPQAPPGAGAIVRSEVTVATGVPSTAVPVIRIV